MTADMTQRDYYEILGVSRSASAKQIKGAYRRLARKYHPDVNKSQDAGDKFKEATAAYEVLSDPSKREVYDRFGHAGLAGGGFGPGRPGGHGAREYTWTSRGGQDVPFDLQDIFSSSPFSGMSLEELLASLGGYSRRGSRRGHRPDRTGEGFDPFAPAGTPQVDVEYPLTLDFLQAVKGCTMALQLRRPDGSTERIEVKIPPGVRDGSKVRVRGKGRPGPSGPGDLFIVTRVREHPYFRREGADIYVDMPISITEAALGGEATVPTVDGHAVIKIPPGASGGTRLRLRGKGVEDPKAGKRGDQYVVLKIALPGKVSDQGRKLLEEFARTDPYDPRKKVPW